MEDCVKCQKEYTFRLKTLEEEIKEGKKALIEHKVRIEKIDESVKSAHLRLDNIGEHTLAIYKLTVAVENIAEQLVEFTQENKEHRKEVYDRLDKQEVEITNLKNAPSQEALDREKQVKNYIFMAIVGAIVGAIFMKLGVKL